MAISDGCLHREPSWCLVSFLRVILVPSAREADISGPFSRLSSIFFLYATQIRDGNRHSFKHSATNASLKPLPRQPSHSLTFFLFHFGVEADQLSFDCLSDQLTFRLSFSNARHYFETHTSPLISKASDLT